MTKSKSPATRGIVARLEEALGPLRASVTESLDGVARRLLREAKNLRAERDELIGKRHIEIERAAAAEQRAEAAEKRATGLMGALLQLRQQVEDTIMVAQKDVDADDFITAYHFKTGAIHRLLAKARDLIPGTSAASAPEAPPDPPPEIERLKAENASLLESLRETRVVLGDTEIARRAAEQRNTELEGALRAVLNDASIRPDGDTYIRLTDTDYRTAQAVLRAASPGRVCPPCLTGDHKNCRDEPDVGMECHCIHFPAALHDEERSAPPRLDLSVVNQLARPATPEEVADRAVGYCRHVTVTHGHDWACAPCIAYWARRVMRPDDFISPEFKAAMVKMLDGDGGGAG